MGQGRHTLRSISDPVQKDFHDKLMLLRWQYRQLRRFSTCTGYRAYV